LCKEKNKKSWSGPLSGRGGTLSERREWKQVTYIGHRRYSRKFAAMTSNEGRQRTTLRVPVISTVISLAAAGSVTRFVLPPGQRTQIPVGSPGDASTTTELSCDQ